VVPGDGPSTRNVHWRLYRRKSDEQVVPICVQDFDYVDYESWRFIGFELFSDERHARNTMLAGIARGELF